MHCIRLVLGLGLVRVSSRVRVRVRVRVKIRVSVLVRVSIRTSWVVNFALFRCYRPVIYTRPRTRSRGLHNACWIPLRGARIIWRFSEAETVGQPGKREPITLVWNFGGRGPRAATLVNRQGDRGANASGRRKHFIHSFILFI